MDGTHSLNAQVLDEDLQIVRATLAAISGDVRQLSGIAGQAVEEALVKIDQAQQAFLRQCRDGDGAEPAPAASEPPRPRRIARRYAKRAAG